MSKLLYKSNDWNMADLERILEESERMGRDEFGLDLYPNQVEIITSEQMLELYTSHGMPGMYKHWSFGKRFTRDYDAYQKGKMGLAYEIVVNTNPVLGYCMEENTSTMQALVISHACVSGDTEYLSPEGWKRIDQYDGGEVAQYNEDGTANFVHPSAHIERDQKDFIYVESASIDQMITDDHRVIFHNPYGNKLDVISGAELERRQATKTRGFNGKFYTSFNMKPDTFIDVSDDELRLDIAIKADGHIINPDVDKTHFNAKPWWRVNFHLKKDRKIERLEALLNRMLIPYEKSPTYDGRYSIHFDMWHLPEKRFTKSYYNASEGQLHLIAEEVLQWDGSVNGTDDSHSYSSAYKDDADFIQYVWASLGSHTSVAWEERAYKVRRANSTFGRGVSKHGRDGRKGPEPFARVPSEDGKAYCFTVPSSMFIIRRNNKISVTGNCVGHNAFFKNNYLMKQWTDAKGIVDYLLYARDFIAKCEERHGLSAVERVLDSAHALQWQGIDKFPRKEKSKEEEKRKQDERVLQEERDYNPMWDLLPSKKEVKSPEEEWKAGMSLPEDNLLYFVQKYSPKLKEWEREIIRIVCKIAQYFYPNIQTKTANEGLATFTHYETMNNWLDRGQITEGNYLEFIKSHTGVITQYGAEDVYKSRSGQEIRPYDGWNPYALGFAILNDVKRMCQNPTEEDKTWFPQFAGSGDYWAVIREACFENRDETFILEYLSPKVIRDFKMFEFRDNEESPKYSIEEIHNDAGYRSLRRSLAKEYNYSQKSPELAVVDVDIMGDRKLVLQHTIYKRRELDQTHGTAAFTHLSRLWGYPVVVQFKDATGEDEYDEEIFDAEADGF